MEFTREVMDGLAAPFQDEEIEFLPRAHSNGKALGLPYIDARTVMNRLDAVAGPGNWSFDFDTLSPEGKQVKGRLTVLGVTRCDAGEASTEDEVLKSAVSDSLKRCAVHFGIGRYLYYLPRVWAPYDSQKRRFTEAPRLERAVIEGALRLCGVGGGDSRPLLRVESSLGPERTVRSERAPGEPESSGDRAATVPNGRPSPSPGPEPVSPSAMSCSTEGCGRSLTKGQHDVSMSKFGQPFCPACQKTGVRAA